MLTLNDRIITWKPYPENIPYCSDYYLVDYNGEVRVMEYLGESYDQWAWPHEPEPLTKAEQLGINAFAEFPEPYK